MGMSTYVEDPVVVEPSKPTVRSTGDIVKDLPNFVKQVEEAVQSSHREDAEHLLYEEAVKLVYGSDFFTRQSKN
jgi:hypothetical protein